MSAKALDTPPSSDVDTAARFPPSPPLSPKKRTSSSAPDRLLGTLRLLKAGKLDTHEDWLSFELTEVEYRDFQQRLQRNKSLRGWFEDKSRCDWEPAESTEAGSKGRFVVRMPSKVHEFFISDLVDGLQAKIRDVADGLEQAGGGCEDGNVGVKELGKVWRGGSVTVEMDAPLLENSSQEEDTAERGRVVKRSPDATLYHSASPALPQLVVEVSYSQQGSRDLHRIAESYIVDSQHAIQCVIGIDLQYQQPKTKGKNQHQDKKATVSVWRPGVEHHQDGSEIGICKTDVDALSFRDSEGAVCEGNLSLNLADLLPKSVLSSLPPGTTQHTLSIPFTDLARYLDAAERNTASSSAPQTSTAPRKFRKRKRSPLDELSEGREAGFEQQEDEAVEKTEQADTEWAVGGRRSGGDRAVEVVERRRSTRRRISGRGVGASS